MLGCLAKHISVGIYAVGVITGDMIRLLAYITHKSVVTAVWNWGRRKDPTGNQTVTKSTGPIQLKPQTCQPTACILTVI